tara:strand:- start:725 stop:961 length:237 start_codon:yes stop_codon:yes gene_type:complete
MVKVDINRSDLDHALSTMKDLRRIAEGVQVKIYGDMANVKLKHLPSCIDEEFTITNRRGTPSVGNCIDNIINFLEGLE